MIIPGVSVILPCYNHFKYLPERVRSVLNQTLPVSQIIFLDDASTDDSFRLAQSLLSNTNVDVSFHLNMTNSGSPFAQWNKGIHLAKHPLIWIAETDDTCDLRFLEILSSKLVNNDAVLAYSQSRYISSENIDLGSAVSYTSIDNLHLLQQDFTIDGTDFNRSFMAKRNSIPNASAVLFCRSTYINVGFANISMRFCGDWDMWIRMASQGRVAFVADELNHFRCHSLTTRSKAKTPRFAAESLACRLSARGSVLSPQPFIVSALWILRQLAWFNPSGISSTYRFIQLSAFVAIYQNYHSLSKQPKLTHGAWLLMLILVCFNSVVISCRRILHIPSSSSPHN